MHIPKLKLIRKAAIAFIWIMAWHFLSAYVSEPVLLPSPLLVFKSLVKLAALPSFWLIIGNSLSKILFGFLLSIIVGVALASICYAWQILYEFLNPLMSVIKAIPIASFTILTLVWVKSIYLSTVISFLMVLPIVYFNIHNGLKNVKKMPYFDMAKVFKVPFLRQVKCLYIPLLMPYFSSTISVGLGLALKSGVAAEVIGLPNNSIGINIYNSKIYLEISDLFAWTIVIILLGALIEAVIKKRP